MKKISIDPRANIVYASYYIYGLKELKGHRNVSFNPVPFKDLIQNNGIDDFDHFFAFVDHESNKKYVVDFRDKNTYNPNALDWCHVYAKINFNSTINSYIELSQDKKSKIIPIGPNFGINLYPIFFIYPLFISNYLISKIFLSVPVSARTFMSKYNWLLKRKQISNYSPSSNSNSNYIFHLSSFYVNQASGNDANEMRATFVRACKNLIGENFEGGLVTKINNYPIEYKDVIVNKFVPHSIYIEKTRRSKLVFNTPSAWGCHGWKLGEYFALGKAIISTPFKNDIPEGIKHNKNIHLVNSKEEIYQAIDMINSNEKYRQFLEEGAKEYYREYLEPMAVIKKIVLS